MSVHTPISASNETLFSLYCKPFDFTLFTDEAMEVDEYDSDLESSRNTEGAPETLDNADNQRQQISTTDNSNLDNVNFSWLEDYFT